MSKVCEICGKGRHVGGSITRRGLAVKKGGIGMHVVKNVKRTFSANIQKVRARVNGGTKQVRICTSCLRANRIEKA